MPWKDEIYRAFFVAFGMFEILTNLSYLLLKNGVAKAIKQHGELPKGISEKKVRTKVICMLTFGIIFFSVGVYSYVSKNVNYELYLVAVTLFSIYAVIEGLYYRYWKTIGFSIVSLILFFLFILF